MIYRLDNAKEFLVRNYRDLKRRKDKVLRIELAHEMGKDRL
jgi:hypothetical protein